MTLYKKILVPISRTSNLKYIMEFVNHFLADRGEISFLHVVESDKIPISPAEWRTAMCAISTTHMLSAESGMNVNYCVKNARSIADGILEKANSDRCDLILVANSSYRKRAKRLFGSKIDEVIKKSPTDIVVLSYFDDMPINYGKVLVPTSGRPSSARAASLAEVLVKKHQSELSVLYVGDTESDCSEALGPIRSKLNAAGIEYRALFRRGKATEEILAEAQKNDLMIIGATEHTIYYEFIIGSIADSLIRKSPCPVLMVKTVIRPDSG